MDGWKRPTGRAVVRALGTVRLGVLRPAKGSDAISLKDDVFLFICGE